MTVKFTIQEYASILENEGIDPQTLITDGEMIYHETSYSPFIDISKSRNPFQRLVKTIPQQVNPNRHYKALPKEYLASLKIDFATLFELISENAFKALVEPDSLTSNTADSPLIDEIARENASICSAQSSVDKDFIVATNEDPKDVSYCYEKKSGSKLSWPSNFILTHPLRLLRIKGNAYEEEYCFSALKDDGFSKQLIVTRSELLTPHWIMMKLGAEFYLKPVPRNYDIMKTLIGDLLCYAQELHIYDQIGWIETDDNWHYLHQEGTIGAPFPYEIVNQCSKKIVHTGISKQESFEFVLSMLKIASPSITAPLLLFNLLAVMNQLFRRCDCEPRFILWITGMTGVRKTTLSKLFFNIFENQQDSVAANFLDTNTSLELKAAEFKDCVMLLDDYRIPTTVRESNEINYKADYILRAYGDRCVKSRSTKKLSRQQEFRPLGLCAVTGECLVDGKSNNARLIEILVESDDVDLNALTYCQENIHQYSSFIYDFIEYLSENIHSLLILIRNRYKHYRSYYGPMCVHGRTADAVSALLTANDILKDFTSSFTNNDIPEFEKIQDAILDILNHQNIKTKNSDFTLTFIRTVDQLMRSGKMKIPNISDSATSTSNALCFQDNDYIYLLPEYALGEVLAVIKHSISSPYPTVRQLAAYLEEKGLIKVEYTEDKKLNRTIKKKINGLRRRYFHINKDRFQELLEEWAE